MTGFMRTSPSWHLFHAVFPLPAIFTQPEKNINFDGRGQKIAVMGLRIGDVFSGGLEVESVKLLTRSGKEVNLDSEKIKRITFKKAKLVRDEAIKKQ